MSSQHKSPCQSETCCDEFPTPERLNYFFGQTLGVAELRAEQDYFRGKLRLHNRCLHGWGIVCGLDVEPCPTDTDCADEDDGRREEIENEVAELERQSERLKKQLEDAEDPAKIEDALREISIRMEALRRALEELPDCPPPKRDLEICVCVSRGLALDCCGNDLILHCANKLDLWKLLDSAQRREIREQLDSPDRPRSIPLYLSICRCEQPTYPMRPAQQDPCRVGSGCEYGRTLESIRFDVSLEAPPEDACCESCCCDCTTECVHLARILWKPGAGLRPEDIDLSLRRPVGTYQPTVITGVSWVQGSKIDSDQAKAVLGTERGALPRTKGLEIRFSRPVWAETLTEGVIELRRLHGGRGVRGVISHIEGSYVEKPASGLIDRVHFRDDSGETLNHGDRVLVTLRSAFVLDRCCKPIDGEHVGGLVPQLEEYREQDKQYGKRPLGPEPPPCASRDHHPEPWTSGNGVPGGSFESWFFIE